MWGVDRCPFHGSFLPDRIHLDTFKLRHLAHELKICIHSLHYNKNKLCMVYTRTMVLRHNMGNSLQHKSHAKEHTAEAENIVNKYKAAQTTDLAVNDTSRSLFEGHTLACSLQ